MLLFLGKSAGRLEIHPVYILRGLLTENDNTDSVSRGYCLTLMFDILRTHAIPVM